MLKTVDDLPANSIISTDNSENLIPVSVATYACNNYNSAKLYTLCIY